MKGRGREEEEKQEEKAYSVVNAVLPKDEGMVPLKRLSCNHLYKKKERE